MSGPFDVFGGDAIPPGGVRRQPRRGGKAWPDSVFGEARTFSGRCERHFVVDDGTGKFLVE
ncbi:hypothetical protein KL864_18255 [Mycolicibacterium goodii]|uniref:hypothetical protein n=1 Tax=Mycolicibacterium goodii TaxID=134601 RepID=UPI001BDC305B|nr:hypothetical protein [Mycolicibacterium goodii]MBU8817844.1 hypothetical protein [Mycolicibacterium goodii]